jgi:hypothetical protein
MKFRNLAVAATIAAVGSAGGVAIGAGVASAAPTNGTASETIARMQSQGNRVVVDKVGTGPMEKCSVTSVRSIQAAPLPVVNPLSGVPNLQRQNTIHVGLKC